LTTPALPDQRTWEWRRRQGCRGYGDSHGDSHGYGMGWVWAYGDCDESPWAYMGILWGFLIGWRLSGNALNMR